MHEVGLIQTVMNEISQVAARSNITRVTKVRLVVGRLNGALPDVLEFAFTVLTPETIFAGAQLEIETVPITLECEHCGARTVTDELAYFCPECSGRARITGGRELYIDFFEGDDGKEDEREGGNGPEDPAGERAGGP
ncbi:hydrogenase expression/synthesis, HypA [Candidatus Desulforudis audaxviator MP104C]|uniref:Hydrogenase maturation factor HypA n=1 Tax=Desulforudis audaxviator (strain MP104C) TaxID=477974 RepID=B1I573_DESAP|nr:hydrogenase expression/synthesis, HypA [Candidatus Desulforudis audaxviator MP104C]AZK60187.1 [NiFe] hydrogenase nickel incorporation protein HypA [Candidatus Desulforudis audaxviator]